MGEGHDTVDILRALLESRHRLTVIAATALSLFCLVAIASTALLLIQANTDNIALEKASQTNVRLQEEATGLCRAIDTSRTSDTRREMQLSRIFYEQASLLDVAAKDATDSTFAHTIGVMAAETRSFADELLVLAPIDCAQLTASPLMYQEPSPQPIASAK